MAKENTAQKAKTKRPKRTLQGTPEQGADRNAAKKANGSGQREHCREC